jgi:hypothetical protein
MMPRFAPSLPIAIRSGAAVVAAAFLLGPIDCAVGQTAPADSVYRVANDTTAVEPGVTVAVPAPAAAAAAPFDFTKQPDEHPLAPVIRVSKATLEHIDRNIRDYSATLVKQERVDGELGEHQHIFLKIRHDPFSVYMSFLKPFQGREVLYVAGQNNNEMVVLEAGFKRMLGKMNLAPEGMVAMRGQKHPVTRVGIRNLTERLIERFEADSQYAECEVTSDPTKKVSGRPATLVQIVHPIPRKNFYAHVTRLFFDNELRIPIHYDTYMWPDQPGGQPPLEESYTYTNLKINNGYSARDFDAQNNPEIFKQ